MARRQNTSSSNHTTSTSTRDSRRSEESYDSRSTANTSLYDSPRPSSVKGSMSRTHGLRSLDYDDELPPATRIESESSTSVNTYSSADSAEDLDDDPELEKIVDDQYIPPLPSYRHEITDANVRPSTPEEFAELFPSMNRLSIRHDDFTSDGNMNLRVDTAVSGRRRKTMQLFHMRMYDLGKREFSLRRYCRDSGREVCHSKRQYIDTANDSRPVLQRSMTNAMKTLTRRAPQAPQLKRTSTNGSSFSMRSRPGTSYSADANDDMTDDFDEPSLPDRGQKGLLLPTNTIKLEFSNYARIDITRRGQKNAKRYEFEWWGHKYSWKRVLDKLTGVVSFHLLRDGNSTAPVAHVVPETRSPNQVEADEYAGGWVPPSYMWISDESILDAMTDVADVIVATGLLALVDDCIRDRWQPSKRHHAHHHHHHSNHRTALRDVEQHPGPKALVQHFFARRNSDHHHSSPLRFAKPVAAC